MNPLLSAQTQIIQRHFEDIGVIMQNTSESTKNPTNFCEETFATQQVSTPEPSYNKREVVASTQTDESSQQISVPTHKLTTKITSYKDFNDLWNTGLEHLEQMAYLSPLISTLPTILTNISEAHHDMLMTQHFMYEISTNELQAVYPREVSEGKSQIFLNLWFKRHFPKMENYGVASSLISDDYEQPNTPQNLLRELWAQFISLKYSSLILPTELATECVSAFNNAISDARQEFRKLKIHVDFSKKVKKVEIKYNSTRKMLDGLFSTYRTLHILELQLALTPEERLYFKNFIPADLKDVFHSETKLQFLKKSVKKLLANNRYDKNMQNLVGYIVKYGHSFKKGFYADIIFFFSENTISHKQHIDHLSIRWSKITNNSGCLYKDNHLSGLNMISFQETQKQSLLFNAIKFLFVMDIFFINKKFKKVRTLQISQTIHSRTSSKKSSTPTSI